MRLHPYFGTFGGVGLVVAAAALAFIGNETKHPGFAHVEVGRTPPRLDPKLIQPTRLVTPQDDAPLGLTCLPSTTAERCDALALTDRPNAALVKLQAQMTSYLGMAPDMRSRREVAERRTPPAD
jgi:hypothetical protein